MLKDRMKRRVLTTAGLVGITVLSLIVGRPSLAHAADATTPQITSISVDDKEDFVVEPGKMEIDVNPGDQLTKYISVTSRIKGSSDFKITTEDFIGSDIEDQPVVLLGGDKSPYSFKDNIIPDYPNFSLTFGDRITVPVTINVPKDAAPGGYYTAVIVSNGDTAAASSTGANGVQTVSRVGVLFFIRVNGPVTESGQVQDFRIADPHFIYQSAPGSFKILFNNTGKIYLTPYGDITITNFVGNTIAELPIDAYFALPNSLRYRTIDWGDSTFRLGIYKATLHLNRGYDNAVDTRTITFVIIPWNILLPLAAGVFILVLLFYLVFSRFEFRRKQ